MDDWVLCKIYKKSAKYIKTSKGQQQQCEVEQLDSAISVSPLHSSVKEANNSFLPYQQENFSFGSDIGEYFVDNMVNGFVDFASLKYNYDTTLMLEKNPTLYNVDNGVSDRNFVPEILGLPSAMPSMDTLDQYINDMPEEKFPQFKFDHQYYP